MEEDPSHDRVVTEILPPPMFNLPHNKLFPTPSLPDWLTLKTHLTQEGKLDKEDIIQLITIFKNIVTKESNIVKTTDPVSIVGDIHGQFYDLIKVLEKGGDPSKTNYLFLGKLSFPWRLRRSWSFFDRMCFTSDGTQNQL